MLSSLAAEERRGRVMVDPSRECDVMRRRGRLLVALFFSIESSHEAQEYIAGC